MNTREDIALKKAVTQVLRYDFNHKMVSVDRLWAKLRFHWCTRETLEHFFRKCCSPESQEHRFQTEFRGGDLYVRCIPSKKKQWGQSHGSWENPEQAKGDKQRDHRNARWRHKDQGAPSGSAADESKKRQSSPQPKPAPRRAPTLFDEKAAHATAVAAEAAAVAEAVVTLANDLKDTANNDESWRKKHFQELIKQWHPDKNPEKTKMSNAVFQYLMEMKAEYLSVVHSRASTAK